MYYFDYASTTKPSQESIELYTKLLNDIFLHDTSDFKTAHLCNEAKQMILNSLQLNEQYDVVFTSGGTEANNLAIIGFAQVFTSSKHFITTKIEHSSVDSAFEYIKSLGHQVTYLNVNEAGMIDVQELKNALQDNTVLVSIMAVNNEIGAINIDSQIRQVIKQHNPKCVYMSDCVQAIGKIDCDYNQFDMLTISAHKLYAPKAIGALVYKKDIKLTRIIHGGEQQDGMRAGTHSVPLEVVLAVAVKTEIEKLSSNIILEQTKKFCEFVLKEPKLELNCPVATNIVSVNFKTKALSESLISVLNEHQIYASTRSACSIKLNKRSRTLRAIGLADETIDRTIRFSFSRNTTNAEVDYLIDRLQQILKIY